MNEYTMNTHVLHVYYTLRNIKQAAVTSHEFVCREIITLDPDNH
jgi:hypothetical protein